jgi:hypothetical protein
MMSRPSGTLCHHSDTFGTKANTNEMTSSAQFTGCGSRPQWGTRIRGHDSRGIAYVAVLILVLIISVLGLAFVQLGELEDRLFLEESRSTQAQFAAEGGIQRVAWSLRNLSTLNPDTLNPFHVKWYSDPAQPLNDTDILDLVNPTSGETFYPALMSPYYRVTDIRGAMTKVRMQVLGAVDMDGDGDEGLGDWDGDGYAALADADLQDTNRFLEVLLKLPGTLGQDVAIAASDILDRYGVPATLYPTSTVPGLAMQTTKNQHLYDFWFFQRVYGNNYKEIFSNKITLKNRTGTSFAGQVELPKGLFLPDGTPDMNYFAGLPIRVYQGDQTFSPDTGDPTAGRPPGEIIWVNGNLFLDAESSSPWDGIDLMNDWARHDVVLVATGNIRSVNLSCGWEGRVVLIGKSIDLQYWKLGSQINGIALASGNIDLEATSSSYEKDIAVYDGTPTYVASYFYGTLLAGGNIRLNHGGWVVVFDPKVINGVMGLTPPTQLLDRFEAEGLSNEGLGACWAFPDTAFKPYQGRYLEDEVSNGKGDSQDPGVDGTAEVLRLTIKPQARDSGVGKVMRLWLDGSPGGDCAARQQDWINYGALRLFMAVDNYRTVENQDGNATQREARFRLILKDSSAPQGQLYYYLNSDENAACLGDEYIYSPTEWGQAPYDYDSSSGDVTDLNPLVDDYQSWYLPRWKKMDLPFSCFQGDVDTFSFQTVKEIQFRLDSFELRWPRPGGGPGAYSAVRDVSGVLRYDPDAGDPSNSVPVRREDPGDPSSRLGYEEPPGSFTPIKWDVDGDGGEEAELRESDLVTSLRIDRLTLLGVTRQNYGLPPFCFEVTGWRELSAEDVLP